MNVEEKIKKKSFKQLANYSDSRDKKIEDLENKIENLKRETKNKVSRIKRESKKKIEDERKYRDDKIQDWKDTIDFYKLENKKVLDEIDGKLETSTEDDITKIKEPKKIKRPRRLHKNEQNTVLWELKRVEMIEDIVRLCITNVINGDSWITTFKPVEMRLSKCTQETRDFLSSDEFLSELERNKQGKSKVAREKQKSILDQFLEKLIDFKDR